MELFPLSLVLLSTVMHASWNLLARGQRGKDVFLPMLLTVSAVGIGPALLAEWLHDPILPVVWPYLLGAGLFEAVYYLGLLRGYQSGDFTVVYPVARSLPVLALALVDVVRGQPPTLWGWLGIGLIAVGCLLLPLQSRRDFAWERYWNPVMVWIGVTAVGTIGYTLVDRQAAQLMRPGWDTAVRYGLFEFMATVPGYWFFLSRFWSLDERPLASVAWRRVTLAAVLMFGAYGLILWAYQLTDRVSYVVAIRQLSIVLGVLVGSVLFREPAPYWRITMALLIVLGIILISLKG